MLPFCGHSRLPSTASPNRGPRQLAHSNIAQTVLPCDWAAFVAPHSALETQPGHLWPSPAPVCKPPGHPLVHTGLCPALAACELRAIPSL